MDGKIALRVRLLYYLGLNYLPEEVSYGEAFNWDMEVNSCAFQQGIRGAINIHRVMREPKTKAAVMKELVERLGQYG